jgi:HEAT repeat protein
MGKPIALLVLLLLAGCGSSEHGRRGSIYELQADPTPENVAQIRELLVDSNRDVRATALHALIGLGVEDAPTLARAGLTDTDGFVRATAAKLLGELQDPRDAALLVRTLTEDSYAMARQRAAEALEEVGGPEALIGLTEGLEDPMERVRMACVGALRRLDPAFAKDALLRVLADDPAWEVRARAARTLGLTGDPEVLPALERALGDPNEFVRSAVTNAISQHSKR